MSNSINPLSVLAATPASSKSGDKSGKQSESWFEAMADAWGQTLDRQAGEIQELADQIGNGNDRPEVVSQLTAEALTMGYLTSSSHTALTAVGSALETMARKQ
jgi:hypothetical protein